MGMKDLSNADDSCALSPHVRRVLALLPDARPVEIEQPRNGDQPNFMTISLALGSHSSWRAWRAQFPVLIHSRVASCTSRVDALLAEGPVHGPIGVVGRVGACQSACLKTWSPRKLHRARVWMREMRGPVAVPVRGRSGIVSAFSGSRAWGGGVRSGFEEETSSSGWPSAGSVALQNARLDVFE